MSGIPHDSKDSGPSGAYQSEDQIDFKKVVAVGLGSLLLFVACTIWAVLILRSETARLKDERGLSAKGAAIGKDEIGIVDQVSFESDDRLGRWQKERSDYLNSFGWVDRAHGIVHIPIEQAMSEVAAGRAPAPTTGKAAP